MIEDWRQSYVSTNESVHLTRAVSDTYPCLSLECGCRVLYISHSSLETNLQTILSQVYSNILSKHLQKRKYWTWDFSVSGELLPGATQTNYECQTQNVKLWTWHLVFSGSVRVVLTTAVVGFNFGRLCSVEF